MPVDVKLDAVGLTHGESVVREDLVLGGVAGSLSAVGLVARVGRGATSNVPLVRPVAVDVCSDAARAIALLAVLAPQAVLGLRVSEAWLVSTWESRTREESLPSGFTTGIM